MEHLHVIVETGSISRVAGAPNLLNFQQERVAIAVQVNGDDRLSVSRSCALYPELVTASAPISRTACRDSGGQRLFVHPSKHQHFATVSILRDRSDEIRGALQEVVDPSRQFECV